MMAPLILKQLAILLWKSWIMRVRHWLSTIFELFVPLVLAFIVVYLYAKLNAGGGGPQPESSAGLMFANKSEQYVGPVIFTHPVIDIEFSASIVDRNDWPFTIYYAPDNAFTASLMAKVRRFDRKFFVIPMSSELALNSKLNSEASNSSQSAQYLNYLFGVIFHLNSGSAQLPDQFEYTIRTVGPMASLVNRLFPTKYSAGPVSDEQSRPYIERFCPLQTAINEAYLELQVESQGIQRKPSRLQAFKFPYPRYLKKGSDQLFSLQDFVAATIAIGYVIMCPLIVKRISDEKAAKAKEMLRMMGMSDWVFWGSHFINYFTVMLFHAFMFAIFYFVGIDGTPIMNYSDGCLFFVIIAIYCAQSILFCMLITTVFNRPVLAVVVTVIVWIVTYGVPFGILNPAFHREMDIIATNPKRLLSSILPNMGLSWCLALFGQFEIYGMGANWSRLYTQTSIYGDLTLGLIMFVMLLSCLLYAILIWYLDSVWPFQYGVPKPFYFPFTRAYWCASIDTEKEDNQIIKESIEAKNFERETPNSAAISIRAQNLRKEFGGLGGQRKVAVQSVSLNVYHSQITVLLGHNGAGKSTTMNMITGIFAPTSGTVYVDGHNIVSDTNKARKSLGLCPQENIIYNELTVEQHLKLYAILKGCPWNRANQEVDKTLGMLQLTDKKRSLAMSLSGGMKRKLALGIAMIADTKILILDEPTSGMDPEARRVVWDLLQELRTERTILLTTHYMEEADVLGDRIAIMSEGVVKCCGSPMFLKKRFGAGYHLRIAKSSNAYNGELVEQILRRYLPNARLHSEIHSEVIYSLDNSNNKSLVRSNSLTSEDGPQITATFPQLFDDIERNKEKLGIASCGLTITTMEDVFLRVGNELETDNNNESVKNGQNGQQKKMSYDNLLEKSAVELRGFDLLRNRVIGLLVKRFHFAKRYLPMIIFQLVVPAALFVVILLTDYSIRSGRSGGTKDLNLNLGELYGPTNGFFKSNDNELWFQYEAKASSYGMKVENIKEDPNVWALKHTDNLDDYIKHYLIGANVDTENNFVIKAWFNSEASHTLPIAINSVYEALINYLLSAKNKVSITVHNHPLVEGENEVDYLTIISGWAITCLLLTPITVPFIGASYILFPINERTSKSKLLQMMTGLSSATFWLCNLAFDLLNHLLAVIIIFFIFVTFDFNRIYFGQANTAIGLFLMLFLFGFASIPLAYCLSLWFNKPSTGFASLVIIYLMFGVIATVAMGPLDLTINFLYTPIISQSTFNSILGVLRLVPVFSMSFGIQKLYRLGSFAKYCRDMAVKNNMSAVCEYTFKPSPLYGCCPNKCGPAGECYESNNPLQFTSNGVGAEFVYLVLTGFVFMAVLMFLESDFKRLFYSLTNRIKSSQPKSGVVMINANETITSSATIPATISVEDSDVEAERQRIEALRDRNQLHDEALAVTDLTKRFTSIQLTGSVTFKAVDRLTFGVHREECFGLLGVNGAGKTTTFSMLTGDLLMSAGNAYIGPHNIRANLRDFQKQIGYCPQFDALLDKLTGREMLYLFARLRGVPPNMIAGEVASIIQMVDLQNHADRRSETYSGGNRRKLSLALAIIGTPPVIFLDEPTAGVDPAARRKIWSTLVYIQERYQSAIVLTSHSMEECEALCSRIAIMVNGQFKCFGPTQHLRSKFGQGYTVVVKLRRELNDDPNYVNSVRRQIQEKIPSATLRDAHQCLLHYHITDTSVQWSALFKAMELLKSQYQFEDYLVSDTTLEQIFLAFARSQRQLESAL